MKTLLLHGLVLGSALAFARVHPVIAGEGKGGKAAPAALSVDELINDLRTGDLEKKLKALNALQSLGPKAKAAVPDLVGALRHKESRVQEAAAEALGKIGPDAKEALPTLKMFLADSKLVDWYFKHTLIHATIAIAQTIDLDMARLLAAHRTPKVGTPLIYSYLDKHAAELTPHLIKLLDDLDVKVRTAASGAFLEMSKSNPGQGSLIKRLGDKAKPIGPALVKQLDDPNVAVALEAANALTHAAPDLGPKAIPFLLKVLKAGNQKQVNGYYVSDVLRPISKAAIPLFIEALDEKNAGMRYEIAGVLALLESSLDPLVQALKHDKALVRAGSAKALALMYTSGAPAAGALVAALKDPEPIVRLAVADALVWTGTNRMQEAVPILVRVIHDGWEDEQKHAVNLLTRIGPLAKSAVPDLLGLLKDKRFPVRFEAALALVAIDVASGGNAVDALVEGVHSSSDLNQHQAAKALAEIGPPAKSAVPALEKLFIATHVHARYTAAEAVARIDPSRAELAVKIISATLGDKQYRSSMVRTYALGSLRRIGSAAASAIPVLEKMLTDDGPFHAEVAVTAVCVGGENAKVAVKFIRVNLVKQPLDDDAYDLYEFLPNIGAHALLFIPEMRTVLEQSKKPYIQEHMCETIAAIGSAAKELEPQLKALIAKTKHKQTIEAAQKALDAIGSKK